MRHRRCQRKACRERDPHTAKTLAAVGIVREALCGMAFARYRVGAQALTRRGPPASRHRNRQA